MHTYKGLSWLPFFLPDFSVLSHPLFAQGAA
jgi:hypothetical protein